MQALSEGEVFNGKEEKSQQEEKDKPPKESLIKTPRLVEKPLNGVFLFIKGVL